jgi:DNA-binding NtrC family response regulator
MRIIRDNIGHRISFFNLPRFHSLRIRTKLLIALIPSTILILITTGVATNWFSSQFLNESVQRNVRLQTLALGHEVEMFLNQCKEDLLELRQGPITESSFINFCNSQKLIRGWSYAGLAYLARNPQESIYLVSWEGGVKPIAASDISLVRPDPRNILQKMHYPATDEVWISPVIESIYPMAVGAQRDRNVTKRVIRFATALVKEDGTQDGLLVLAVSVYQLRDILSQFNSPQSPIFAFVRSPELRYSFFFDKEGWTWFQSEPSTDKAIELSTQLARSGFSGTFGKPGIPCAFKPFAEHAEYWQMVRDIQLGKSGLITVHESHAEHPSMTDTFYMGYAPVRFLPGPDQEPIIFAGVAFVDRSRLGLWAGYRQIDVIFVIALITTLLVSILIYALSRAITRPIFDLAAAVNRIQETGELKEIELPEQDYETNFLKDSINNMLVTIRDQVEEIQIKDDKLLEASQRERAKLEEEIRTLKQQFFLQDLHEIVGLCPTVESLKMEIIKAASVDADVLILGETGTGKQLTAEAIHRHSSRSEKPFVSINCGALDESLLLDELFGHVKGAFTEAKMERKGAFLASHGGTLFLDEIGTASPKVQQSLLRAIALRKISPLGSDNEFDVDVRIIAATNEDLKDLVERGQFREDLYYRLNVLTIRTPALRDHKEDIPVLADHFLREAGCRMNKEYIGITRGALEKLKAYDWPGNVREFKNCITRAVAMAEGALIHTQDVQLEGEYPCHKDVRLEQTGVAVLPYTSGQAEDIILPEVQLNERQKKAIAVLLENGEISRSEYQKVVGEKLPTRTAVYDLQDMAKKGIVQMVGRGPATRYKLVGWQETGAKSE